MKLLIALSVIFSIGSIILGEVYDFYNRIWWWDLALHLKAGWLLSSLIGFVVVRTGKHSPVFTAIIVTSLSVNLLVIWEFFEFYMDFMHGFNMMKSGLIDTIEDLAIGWLGALIGSSSAYRYTKGRKFGYLVKDMIRYVQTTTSSKEANG